MTERQRGRPPKPPEDRVTYERRPVSLRRDQWDSLHALVVALQVLARFGAHADQPSWRALIARIADASKEIAAGFAATGRGESELVPGITLIIQRNTSQSGDPKPE